MGLRAAPRIARQAQDLAAGYLVARGDVHPGEVQVLGVVPVASRRAHGHDELVGHRPAQHGAVERRIDSGEDDRAVARRQQRCPRREEPVVAAVAVDPAGNALAAGRELELVAALELDRQVVVEVVGQPEVSGEGAGEDGEHRAARRRRSTAAGRRVRALCFAPARDGRERGGDGEQREEIPRGEPVR